MAARKCTDEQIRQSLKNHNGIRTNAARELGITSRALMARLERMDDIPSSTYHMTLGAQSTLRDGSGNVLLQWDKTQAKVGPEQIATAIREALTDIPKAAPVPASNVTNKDLLTVYPIGDHHVGMYAWAEETGNDYDLKIAERLLVSAITHLVDLAPPSGEAVIIDVGDFTHYDNIKGQTERSHNQLDTDTRYHAMIRVALRLLVACVEAALRKHKLVTLICAPGNHNDMGAAWMIESMALYYSRNPRVKVVAKAGKFFYHEFGKVLLGVTHGDTGKPEKLAGVMAVDCPEAWGRTKHRHWHTGHVHNKSQIEIPGATWETHRTLAPADAWAASAGYRSGRDMNSIVYHREHGEVARSRFDIGMLK